MVLLTTSVLLISICSSTARVSSGTWSCPSECTCNEQLIDRTVTCDKGGIDDRRLGLLLQSIPADIQRIRIIGPTYARRNRFRFSMDFARFRELKELHLVNNEIEGLGKGALAVIPTVRWLDLSHNRIGFVDVSTFYGVGSLQHLDLSHNELGNGGLTSGTFRYLTELRWLSLAHNNITEAPSTLFDGGASGVLETLDLSGNRLSVADMQRVLLDTASTLVHVSLADMNITHLPHKMFAEIRQLQRLNLAANQLNGIPTLALLGARQLRTLDLSNNSISYITENALYGTNIEELVLAHNHLGVCYSPPFNQSGQTYGSDIGLHSSAFTGTRLVSLDLSYNHFRTFHSQILGDAMRTVRTLKLNGNPLGELVAEQTRGMTLTALHVADIRLYSLPDLVDDSLHELIVLNVSHNVIEHVNYATIKQMPLLAVFDLAACRLRAIDDAVLHLARTGLEQMHLNDNPLDCHCHVMPLQQYLRKKMHQYPAGSGYYRRIKHTRCVSPDEFYGQPVVAVQRPPDCAILFGASSGLTQKSELGILGAMLSGAILIIGVIILMVYVARTWRRKGVYHTQELSASQTNLSSDSSNLSHHHHHYAHSTANVTERLF